MTMSIDKPSLFNNAMATKDENSIYYQWDPALVSAAQMNATSRAVTYDSNLAFTDGSGDIMAGGGVKSVPNLYETLNGFNKRINELVDNQTQDMTYLKAVLTNDNQEVSVWAHDGSENPLPMELSHNLNAFVIGAEDFKFKFKNGAEYTMADIFGMIEELDARTRNIKTNASRSDISSTYMDTQTYTLTSTEISEN